jgi:hypothetical protein
MDRPPLLHTYLRGDVAAIDAALDELDHQIRQMRRVLADTRTLADAIWILENPEEAVDAGLDR